MCNYQHKKDTPYGVSFYYDLFVIIRYECLAAMLTGLLTEETVRKFELDFIYIKSGVTTWTDNNYTPFAHKKAA